ncbi:methyltransferase-like protein 22 isoform X2 [Glandiceps talaboti]
MICEDEEFLSDVHVQYEPSSGYVHGGMDRKVWKTVFKFKKKNIDGKGDAAMGVTAAAVAIDEDGDYIVTRQQESEIGFQENLIIIEHSMATPVRDVGLQVWNGAMLLCDYILDRQDQFKNTTVLELGAGVGLSSIVMATIADKVFCTDVGIQVLETCRKNVERNEYIRNGNPVIVRELDWMKSMPNTDDKDPFHWRKEDLWSLRNDVSVVIAADVVYDDALTDGFFRTVYNLMTNGQTKIAYIAIEKRLNFTVADMDITCSAYEHFKDCLEFLRSLENDTDKRFTVTQLSTEFPQYFQYARIAQLELWKISCELTPHTSHKKS